MWVETERDKIIQWYQCMTADNLSACDAVTASPITSVPKQNQQQNQARRQCKARQQRPKRCDVSCDAPREALFLSLPTMGRMMFQRLSSSRNVLSASGVCHAEWPINPILTIPSTGAAARNKCARSPMKSAIKALGTQSYGSWQTTNFLLLGRKNEPTFWVPKTQVRQGADRDKRGRTHGRAQRFPHGTQRAAWTPPAALRDIVRPL